MNFRPQFAYPPPPFGMEDEQFHYSFDGTSTPLLAAANAIAPGGFSNNIILPMEADALFLCRAIKIRNSTSHSVLSFQLKTPRGDYMQAVPVPIADYASHLDGDNTVGHLFIPLESEIEAPSGSNWTLYLANTNTTGGSIAPPAVTLFGVKRRKCPERRAA
jgi:hypothetical protein